MMAGEEETEIFVDKHAILSTTNFHMDCTGTETRPLLRYTAPSGLTNLCTYKLLMEHFNLQLDLVK